MIYAQLCHYSGACNSALPSCFVRIQMVLLLIVCTVFGAKVSN